MLDKVLKGKHLFSTLNSQLSTLNSQLNHFLTTANFPTVGSLSLILSV